MQAGGQICAFHPRDLEVVNNSYIEVGRDGFYEEKKEGKTILRIDRTTLRNNMRQLRITKDSYQPHR